MNNHKSKVWPIIAGIIFVLAVLATAGLFIKVAGLNMLPMKYVGLAILAVVILFLIIFVCFFLVPAKAKKVVKYVIRTMAVLLTLSLVMVDIVGIQMVNKFEETMDNLVDDEDQEVKVEEFVIGVYVLVDDKAETLDDVKRYDIGYSLSYDRNNTKKAIGLIENELDRDLELEEYRDIFEMVDDVLAKEKDAFILSTAYFDIMEEQEGYADILDKVKCVHECVVTSETQVAEREEKPFDITQDPFVIYVSGHDTNYIASRANSDVNILAVVNPATKQVLLVNTPRDFYVPISVSEDGALDKLTHCGAYGVECSMNTLSNFYDVDIKYYAQLNFVGFQRLVDALGGITVYSEKEFYSTNEGIYFQKGANEVNGEQALAFVRERKQFGGGDRARGNHQMAVIKGMIEKMSSGSLLLKYNEILDCMGGYFRFNVAQEELAAVVKMQLNDMATWNVQSYAVTGIGESNTCYSMPNLKTYVMVPDEDTVTHAQTLINMVLDGETIEAEDLVVPKED
ncbi:MAG: LCP family protein [Agathobacter sp.]|nr:LCP family protein [Agathobacter sp.]